MNPRRHSSTILPVFLLALLFLPGAASAAELLAPMQVRATAASTSAIDLSWTDINVKLVQKTETGYSIERMGAGGTFAQIGTAAKGVTTYRNTGLASSTSYYYRVRTLGRSGVVSPYSSVVGTTTFANGAIADVTPPVVSITSPASGTLYSTSQTVSITASASDDVGVTKVEFYDGTTLMSTDTTSPYAHAWSFTSANNGTHSWTAKAYDASGKSTISAAVSATVNIAVSDTAAPSIPTGLTASAAGCSQINLSWTASSDTGGSGLAGYKVFRNGVQIATTNVTSYSSTGLAASTSYSFSVAAYDNAGNASGQSTSASSTTPSCPDMTAPSIPTGVTASAASCSQINLSWTASTDTGGSGIGGYKVFRNGVEIATTNVASYNSIGLAASTSYSFTVAAYDNAGNTSGPSTSASSTTPSCPDTTAPSIPTGLTASAASCSQINLSWTASTDTGGSGIGGYKVFRNGVEIATTNVASYNSIGLAASTSYSFTVAAYDNAGNASAQSTAASATTPSCPDTAAPSIPTGLTAAAASCSQVNLSWTGSSDTGGSGLAGYRVYLNGVQIATTSVTSYSSIGLAASTSYSFSVAAYDNAGNASAQSTAASATTPACADTAAPSIPTGLAATAAGCSQVNLSWTGSSDTGGSGLAGYRVYRNGVQIGTTSATSYSSTGLAASTGYSFTVAAYDNAGNASAQSTAASATTPACADTAAPSIPTGLTAAAASCSQVNLSWTGSSDTGGSGLAGYRVYRNGVQIGTTSATSYSSTGLAASTGYSFTVAAYDNAGNASAQSSAASATTPACADTAAPSIPTGLTASVASCSQVNLSWTASSDTGGSGLAGYKVFLNGVQIATTNVTSYSSTGLAASTSYSFSVAAYDNAGNASGQSTSASSTTPSCPDTTAPSIPTGPTAAAAGCSQVNLSWTASTDTGGSGLAGYKVFRNGVEIATTSVASYSSTGLTASTGYSFTVAAYDNAGNASAQSTAASATTPACADTAAPSIPTGLTAAAAGCSQVNLSWTGSSDTGGSGLAGYRVYRNGVQIGTTSATSYSSTGLTASTGYSFTVAAYDNAGNLSAPSTAASATTPACADTAAPSIPTGLTAAAASCSQVNLSWTGSSDTGGSGLAGYRVYRNGVQIATTSVASYSSTGLAASTSYSFTVAAYDNAGNASAQSTSASSTTPSCADTTAPSIPTGLTAAASGCSQVNLSWTGSSDTGGSGLAGYRVYRNAVQIATTSVASYSSTGLAASTGYSFTVAAYDNAGNLSAPSTAASATTPSCANLPPIANAGLDQTTTVGTAVTFNGSGSSDSDGTITAYAWDFGDGTSGTGSIVNHVYSTSGTETVTLTVTDNSGARTSDLAFVDVLTSASGQHLWSKGFGGPTYGDDVIVNAVAADANGNVVITGQFRGSPNFGGAVLTSSGDMDAFIAKYSSSGALLWSKRFGSTGTDSSNGIGVDTSGNVLVIGQFQGTVDFGGGSLICAGGTDIFIAKYSSSGAHLWSKRFGGTGNDIGYGIAVEGNGDMALTGYFGYSGSAVDFGGGPLTSAGGPDIFVAKFSASGVHAWSRALGGTGQDVGLSVGVDGGGNVVVTGYFTGTVTFGSGPLSSAGAEDIFLVKYSASGAPVWSKRFGGAGGDRGLGVAVSGTGDVVVTGYWNGTADFGGGAQVSTGGSDIFLAKYSSAGTHTWDKVFGTGYGYGDAPHGVALDASGNIALTGSLLGSVDFGGGPLVENGSYDIFAAKFSASGAHLWSKRFGVTWDDHGVAIAMDAGGNVVVVGDFYQEVDFGGGALLSPGGINGFLAKFGP